MSRPVCGNCLCTYDDDGTCGCPDDQSHYKKVIDDVQALFEAKREEAAIWQAAYETEKGFREQEQQELASASVEPVAHMNGNGVVRAVPYPWGDKEVLTPLYTSPPAIANAGKPWVELTKEEILEINDTVREQQGWLAFVRAIEAKLKEKNHE